MNDIIKTAKEAKAETDNIRIAKIDIEKRVNEYLSSLAADIEIAIKGGYYEAGSIISMEPQAVRDKIITTLKEKGYTVFIDMCSILHITWD